ncbi:MAG: hypothetical protein ACK4R8_07495 [Thiobacillus sp.]
MRIQMLLLSALLVLPGLSRADDNSRYQALPLSGTEGGKGAGRAFILDTRDGHVWVWSESELFTTPDGSRRYGAGFVYQGKLRPGSQPGEFIDPKSR